MNKYETVAEFLDELDENTLDQVNELRGIIFEAEPNLIENIKWNAPNYVHNGEDRITFNVMNKEGKVKLVLHMGATRKEDKNAPPELDDPENLGKSASNIRTVITFENLQDILAKEEGLKDILRRWLTIQ
ncbi:MAG: DUF1801 domain-containing protein [Candidatus Saccharimonadales bacterium]